MTRMKRASDNIHHVTYIYTLADPRDNTVRYVGKSVDPQARYRFHFTDREPVVKYRWFQDMKAHKVRPVLAIIETTDEAHAFQREAHWIQVFAAQGTPLVNVDRRQTFKTRTQH